MYVANRVVANQSDLAQLLGNQRVRNYWNEGKLYIAAVTREGAGGVRVDGRMNEPPNDR